MNTTVQGIKLRDVVQHGYQRFNRFIDTLFYVLTLSINTILICPWKVNLNSLDSSCLANVSVLK